MQRAGYVERVGRGIKTMFERTREVGLPVKFGIENFTWKVTFPRKIYGKTFPAARPFNFGDDGMTTKRSDRLVQILELIARRVFVKSDFANSSGVSNRTVETDLNYLSKQGLIGFKGKQQEGKYQITEVYQQGLETGLSPTSLTVARMFVVGSADGGETEEFLSIEKIEDSVGVRGDHLIDTLHELEQNGLVKLFFRPGKSAPVSAAARQKMFAKLDRYWMGWNPEEDAKALSIDLISQEAGHEISSRQVAAQYKEGLRRANPALYVIKKNVSRLTPPDSRKERPSRLDPDQHSWDVGKSAGQSFLKHAYSTNMEAGKDFREAILLRCIRSSVEYLNYELYAQITHEKTPAKGFPGGGVYLVSTPEKMRKLTLIQSLQKLAKDIKNEEVKLKQPPKSD